MVFGIPSGLNGSKDYSFIRNAARYLQFKIDAVTWPSVSLRPAAIRRFGYGPMELAPWTPLFNTIKITVLCGGMGEEWTFFRRWVNLISNFHHGYDVASTQQDDPFPINGAPQDVYELAYSADYETDIQLRTYREGPLTQGDDQEILRVVIRRAFPVEVATMVYDWADTKKIQEFNITFAFFDWYQEVLSPQLTLGATTTNMETLGGGDTGSGPGAGPG